jgi:DNA modification methylase
LLIIVGHSYRIKFTDGVIAFDLEATRRLVAALQPLALPGYQQQLTGDNVLDLFGGSGSTLMAAERLGMCARLSELDPGYCDVIVARWEAYTGRKAVLEVRDDG